MHEMKSGRNTLRPSGIFSILGKTLCKGIRFWANWNEMEGLFCRCSPMLFEGKKGTLITSLVLTH